MRFIKLTLSYDGTDFAGWQTQPGRRTVQSTLENAIRKITGESVSAVASGRTDAGVHALGQVVGFVTVSNHSCSVFRAALNANLPRDVVVLEVCETWTDFHAIRDAQRKTYRYEIQDGDRTDVFTRRTSWRVPCDLDVGAMRHAAQQLTGSHDFSSFESSGSERATSIRTIYHVAVQRQPYSHGGRIVIELTANGFLYNMVRAIVGTLVQVGRGALASAEITRILEAKNRKAAGVTAPPQGLFLLSVEYDSREE